MTARTEALGPSPSSLGVSELKRKGVVSNITKNKNPQQIELSPIEPTVAEEKSVQVGELEYEIECPRCSDTMTLCSGFDYLYYSCEDCGFVLSDLRK
jgi:Zn finger protein HypA/HybF involved in hydrogenase expression